MAALEEARAAVVRALGPVTAYCERAHATADATDPALAGKFRHVTQLEALTEAVIDYGAAAEAQSLPCPPDTAAFIACIRAGAAFQAALERPPHLLLEAAAITSHCLPLPLHARSLVLQPV